eukprot:2670465-Lingulodinium_polyedra.AAC.1
MECGRLPARWSACGCQPDGARAAASQMERAGLLARWSVRLPARWSACGCQPDGATVALPAAGG